MSVKPKYWGVWWEGREWPSLYSNEAAAHTAAMQSAKEKAGRNVYWGPFSPKELLVVPDTMLRTEL